MVGVGRDTFWSATIELAARYLKRAKSFRMISCVGCANLNTLICSGSLGFPVSSPTLSFGRWNVRTATGFSIDYIGIEEMLPLAVDLRSVDMLVSSHVRVGQDVLLERDYDDAFGATR